MQLQPARCIGVAAHQFARRTTLFQVLQPRIASKDREIAPKPSYQQGALTAHTANTANALHTDGCQPVRSIRRLRV